MKNEKWNSSWSIKRKTPMGVEIDELIDSRAFSVEVGGKFEIKGAQRPSEIYSPRPVEVNRGTTGREIQRERERGGNRPWNGRWSRCALPTRNWPPWSDCIHRSIHIRGEGEKLARRSSSPASIPPAPVSFLCASGPIRLFLVEYPTKWEQVLRRICGIDGTHLSGRMVYPRADRGSYE